jgi:hypothetical protein
VPAAVDEVLRAAEQWLGWDGAAVRSMGNVWTPHKVLRRVTDHLVEHLAELDARLAGLPCPPDRWHGRRLTLDADWARFTEADLDEAGAGCTGSPCATGPGCPGSPTRRSTACRRAAGGRCARWCSTSPGRRRPTRGRCRAVTSRVTSVSLAARRGRLLR